MNKLITLKNKDMKRIILLSIGFLLFLGCKEHELKEFDLKNAYINFAVPDHSDMPKERFLDSMTYSFATDTVIGIKAKTLAIPIKIGGLVHDKDRKFSFEIVPTSDYDPDLVSISEPIIRANKYEDTLFVSIKRDKALLTKEMNIILRLNSNENFNVGHLHNSILNIKFNDILLIPNWWNEWEMYFGPFYKEVFQQWMVVYYLGSDLTADIYTGKPGPVYFWRNMPEFPNPEWFPITFMHISLLKKYFEDHVVYPNGDNSQERILLP